MKGILINDYITDPEDLAELTALKKQLESDFKVKIEINTDSVCADGAGKKIVEQALDRFGDV